MVLLLAGVWAAEPVPVEGIELEVANGIEGAGPFWTRGGEVFAALEHGELEQVHRWSADGTLVGTVTVPRRSQLRPTDDRSAFVVTTSSEKPYRWWVYGADLDLRASGTCSWHCFVSWQPGGHVLAVVSKGSLELVDARTGRIRSVPTHEDAAVAHIWSDDGASLCYLDRILSPKGRLRARVDYEAADLVPERFTRVGCRGGVLVGHGQARGADTGGMSYGEAVRKDLAVPIEVDRKGTRRTGPLDRKAWFPSFQHPPFAERLERVPGSRIREAELEDGRTIYFEEGKLFVTPLPAGQ